MLQHLTTEILVLINKIMVSCEITIMLIQTINDNCNSDSGFPKSAAVVDRGTIFI